MRKKKSECCSVWLVRYFTLITASTVGYGDITPKNQLGYAVVVLIIVAVLTVFPWMISGIMDALAQAKGKQTC